MKIPFNVPYKTGYEQNYIAQAVTSDWLSGDGDFSKKSANLISNLTGSPDVLLTPSCTHALEMCALLLDLKRDDEIIVPAYTFVSTANAFHLRGAKIIFADINEFTLGIDIENLPRLLTKNTKAVVCVHYAGMDCGVEDLRKICDEHGVFLIEDAAQAVDAFSSRGRPLGSVGDLGCLSFHETKNLHCGEGGALLVNNQKFTERAEIIRDKGTNRRKFYRGEVDKYTWVDLGSSYLMNELSAAFLFGQLQEVKNITQKRYSVWAAYSDFFERCDFKGLVAATSSRYKHQSHNSHIFYVKFLSGCQANDFMKRMRSDNVHCVSHYVSLNRSPLAEKILAKIDAPISEETAETLVRLPLWIGLKTPHVIKCIEKNLYEMEKR